MLEWLAANAATIIISALIIAAVVLIIVFMRRGKKQGKTSCGCGNCPMNEKCHPGSD